MRYLLLLWIALYFQHDQRFRDYPPDLEMINPEWHYFMVEEQVFQVWEV